jgi:hypothetical protein
VEKATVTGLDAIHPDAVAPQHPIHVFQSDQESDPVDFKALVVFGWLIQSHPQAGTASAKPVEKQTDGGLALTGEQLDQRLLRSLGHLDPRTGRSRC